MPVPALPPRRIRVVGVSGSGKTHLAARVAARLRIAHLELDGVFWGSDWTLRNPEDARNEVREFVGQHPEGWVADGNWATPLDGLLDPPGGADLVVWLDQPRWLVMARVLRRTLRRGLTREELWHGNRERPASWFQPDPEKNILLWAWTAYDRTRDRYLALVGAPWFLRLEGPREVARWLESLPRA